MRPIARLLLLCLSLFSLPSLAETLSDLYQVREPVADQQPEAREAALGRALETLVLRLTGSRDAAQHPALAALRAEPQQIVSRYGYEGDSLLVEFDPQSTDRQLRQAGLALWGANRPAILAWWLNLDAAGSSLIGDGQDSAAPLRRAAQHRGLPLRLPLADLGEQLVATPENLGANDPAALRSASERYAADALLAVQAREADGQWQAQWRLWLGDEREQGQAQAADPHGLADAVLLAVSQRLAPRFVAAPGAASSLTLEVQGVDLARYAELQRTLEPLGAQLSQVQGDRVVYRINASAEQLRAQLGLLRLQEVPAEAAAADTEAAGAAPAGTGETPAASGAASQAPAGQAAPQVLPRSETLRFRW